MLDIYSGKLIKEGVATKEEVEAVVDKYDRICEDAFKKAAEETQVSLLDVVFLLECINIYPVDL